MKKQSIIETQPPAYKKGGPPSPLEKHKRDGEHQRNVYFPRSTPPSKLKKKGKKK